MLENPVGDAAPSTLVSEEALALIAPLGDHLAALAKLYVACACGKRLFCLLAWAGHLAAAGQHPRASDLRPALPLGLRQPVVAPRSGR
jgi:hypothetical protein